MLSQPVSRSICSPWPALRLQEAVGFIAELLLAPGSAAQQEEWDEWLLEAHQAQCTANPTALCPLVSTAERLSQTPNGGGVEAPKPLHRSRLPAPRPGGDEPGRPPAESRPQPRTEPELGKLGKGLQDGGAKPPGRAANGVVTSPALRTATLQARRPAPRPGICGREGECVPGAWPEPSKCPSQPSLGEASRWPLPLSLLSVVQQEWLGDQNSLRCGHG